MIQQKSTIGKQPVQMKKKKEEEEEEDVEKKQKIY